MGGQIPNSTHVALRPTTECHYPADKCNAARPQIVSGGYVSSVDSGSDTDSQLFSVGSKAGPDIGPDIRGCFGSQKTRYFFRAPATAPATFFSASIL